MPLIMMRLLNFFFLLPLVFASNTVLAGYLEVTFLGTGTPQPDIDRFGPATMVEANGRYFLFDTGRGVTIRLKQAGIPLSKIEHVFLTHLHSDHVSGLADLMLTGWIWQRQNPLTITGPKGTQALGHHLEQAHQADIAYRSANTRLDAEHAKIKSHEIKKGGEVVYDNDGIKITAFLVNHYPVEPAYGYKIESGEQSIVISGDTSYSENLILHAKETDLLIHEIADAEQQLITNNPRLKRVMAYHTTPEQAASILNQVNPKQAIFTHVLLFVIDEQQVSKKIKNLYRGKFHIANDLLRVGVGKEIRLYPENSRIMR